MASKVRDDTILANPSWNKAQNRFFGKLRDALPVVMGYMNDEIPLLDNHSDAAIVDETGLVKQVKKAVEKAEKAHVERLKARLGDKDGLKGDSYEATYRGGGRIILNQEKCKEVIAAFDAEGVSITRLLAALQSGQVSLTAGASNVLLNDPDDDMPAESNRDVFFTSAAGGRSLYVEEM